MIISSKDNKLIKLAASLSEKKYRDELGLFLLEGPNAVAEAWQQGGRLRFIFTRAGASIEDLGIEISELSPAVYELTGDVFAKVCNTENSQGIAAVAEKRIVSETAFFRKDGSNVLVLDRIQDPGNMGTLLRTAEAMGFAGALLVKGCTDPWGPKVVRAAAGSILRFPMLFAQSAEDALDILARHGKKVYCTAMNGRLRSYEADLKENAAIVIGNEGNGASDVFMKNAETLAIPMAGSTESLNAAFAGAIIMYESERQSLCGKNKEDRQ